MIDILISIQ